MRLIDADALMETLGIKEECTDCQYHLGYNFCARSGDFVNACEAIINAPTESPTSVNLSDLYPCDPAKNTECTKTGCHINGGECFLTTQKKYSKLTKQKKYSKGE